MIRMEHLEFIYYLIAFSLNVAFLWVIIYRYRERGEKILLYYFLFFLSLVLTMVIDFMQVYIDLNLSDQIVITAGGVIINSVLNFFPNIMLFIFLPLIIKELYQTAHNKWIYLSGYICAGLFVLAGIGEIWIKFDETSSSNLDISLTGRFLIVGLFVFFTIILFILSRPGAAAHGKTFIKRAFICHLIFLPLLIYDLSFIDFFPFDFYPAYTIIFEWIVILHYRNKREISSTESIASFLESLSRFNLTKRELEVTDLILKGYSNKEISSLLFISIYTVKNHVSSILSKTNFRTRHELTYAALDAEDG